MLLEGETANVSTGDKVKGCFTLIADRTEWTRMYIAAMHHNTNWKKSMNPLDEERMTKCLFQAYSLETIPVDVIGVGICPHNDGFIDTNSALLGITATFRERPYLEASNLVDYI